MICHHLPTIIDAPTAAAYERRNDMLTAQPSSSNRCVQLSMTTCSRFRFKSACSGRMPSAAVAYAPLPAHVQAPLRGALSRDGIYGTECGRLTVR